MLLKKVNTPQPNQHLAVLIEPAHPTTDAQAIKQLNEFGAKDIDHLAPGFISATVPESELPRVRSMGRVQVKQRQQMHGV